MASAGPINTQFRQTLDAAEPRNLWSPGPAGDLFL